MTLLLGVESTPTFAFARTPWLASATERRTLGCRCLGPRGAECAHGLPLFRRVPPGGAHTARLVASGTTGNDTESSRRAIDTDLVRGGAECCAVFTNTARDAVLGGDSWRRRIGTVVSGAAALAGQCAGRAPFAGVALRAVGGNARRGERFCRALAARRAGFVRNNRLGLDRAGGAGTACPYIVGVECTGRRPLAPVAIGINAYRDSGGAP